MADKFKNVFIDERMPLIDQLIVDFAITQWRCI